METSTSRKIWSVIGLLISTVMLSPVNNAIDNLHGHTTRAAIYGVIFLLGMMIAWMSVMNPVYKAPTPGEQKQAEIETQKQDEKGDKSTFWIGIMVVGVAIFFFLIDIYLGRGTSFFILTILMGIIGVVLIVTSRPKRSRFLDNKFNKNSSFYLIWGIINLILAFIFFAVGSFGTILGVMAIIFGIICMVLYFVFKAKGE